MVKVGRNERCPCGSGKKYKKCCEARDQLTAAGARSREMAETLAATRAAMADMTAGLGELGEQTDRVTELIDAGELDEAERIARKVEADHPEEPAGAECLAMIYEARGLRQHASEQYRRAVALMEALGEGNFCDCCRARMVKSVRRLDPEGPALELGRDPQ